MKKFHLLAYEEVGYDVTYEIEAESIEQAEEMYREFDVEGIEEVDSDFVGTMHREITEIVEIEDES